ncbi:MAG: glycosyltransferase family 4 protein [Actinomycetia bacterium]|nr:glycosyltransferase family 4 protein [Actinomycetes bacterium]
MGGPRVALTLEQCWHEVPGGTARAAVDLAAELDRRAQVELVGVSAWHRDEPRPEYAPPIPIRSLPLPRLAMYEGWHHLRLPRVEWATGRVDVVHATGISYPATRAPVVATLHDLAFLRFPELYTTRGNSFFRKALELTRRHARIVCCSSQQTLDDCADAGIAADRLRLVPLGVGAQRASAADIQRVRSRYGLDRPYVLWTGTREPRKNLVGLVAAFRALGRDDLDLVLVGPDGWHEDQTGLAGDPPPGVKTVGFVPSVDLAAIYAGAAVFCWPSLFEGFGFPVLEAMTQGTPVITSRGTSTEELAGDSAVLVTPTDTDSIAEALSSVLDDEALRSRLIQAGPQRASTFSWSRTAELTEQVYVEACG